MLGKLMKYEFRATAIYFLPIYVVLVLVSGLRYVVSLISQKFSNGFSAFSGFSLSAIYLLLALGLAITTFIVIIIRFYKNLLGTEGYLMFTLPVSVEQNILAKLIPSVVWFFGSCVLGMLTIAPAMGLRFNDNPFTMFTGIRLGDVPEILLAVLMVIGSIAGTFLFYYLCMCIGQMFNSHRFLASAGAYIVIQTVLQILGIAFIWICASSFSSQAFVAWLSNAFAFLDKIPSGSLIYLFLIAANILSYGIAAALFFIDSAILRKRLNLV
ncbi:MAG: hypothetical protein MR987_01175 [Oscillospiraceae bacterium]|nr:hypothetical protein [Oscillospiraceae bacterium]